MEDVARPVGERLPFDTPTGAPCPRTVRADGTVEGAGHCVSCGCCLLLVDLAWPEEP